MIFLPQFVVQFNLEIKSFYRRNGTSMEENFSTSILFPIFKFKILFRLKYLIYIEKIVELDFSQYIDVCNPVMVDP